jgi:hypothetical protein
MMKSTKRNLMIALGLVTSLTLPGLAMADSWKQQAQRFSTQQRQEHRDYGHDGYREREMARRGDDGRHEWRERNRYRHGVDRDDYYSYNEWREHAHRYYAPRHYYGYGVYPGAYVSGIYISPAPRLVIDLR